MEKVLGSRIDLSSFDTSVSIEFNDMISDLINTDAVQELCYYSQHCETSRLQHSLNVSYYSYLIAKFFNLDARSAARGGLLHDLFYYNWKESGLKAFEHSKEHPLTALENAKELTVLNKVEEDIIVKHMWPMTPSSPKYLESFIVTLVDKYCATIEVVTKAFSKLSGKKSLAFGTKSI